MIMMILASEDPDPHTRIARKVYVVSLACSALVISTTFYLETRVSKVMFPKAVGYAFVALGQLQPIFGVIGAWRRSRNTLFLFWFVSIVVVIVSFIFICVWLGLYANIRVLQDDCKHTPPIHNVTKEECDKVDQYNLAVQKGGLVFLGFFFLVSIIGAHLGKRFYDRVIVGHVELPREVAQRIRVWGQDPLLASPSNNTRSLNAED